MRNINQIKDALIKRDGLRCAVTGEDVNSADELQVDHLVPRNKGGTDELDNLILVKKEINAYVSDDERRRTRLLLNELKDRQNELAQREAEIFDREAKYRKQIESQERQLEDFRARLRQDQADREELFNREFDAERSKLREQQALLQAKLIANEQAFNLKLNAFDSEKAKLLQSIQEKEDLLQLSFQELEAEKKKYTEESRQKIQSNSTAYVNEALSSLDTAANDYKETAKNWSKMGLAALLCGVVVAIYFGLIGFHPSSEGKTVEWPQVVFFGFKGLIVISLFVAIAKYCFTYAQSFMHESLKNSERRHAIKFGKFYLESFGANAEWGQVREAFEHWNIAPSSAFSNSDPEKFDPKTLEKAANLIESISKLKPQKPNEGKSEKNG